MAQSSDPSSSSRPRKRKFEEVLQKRLEPQGTLETPGFDGLTTSDAISCYFQLAYDEQLAYDRGSMRSILDPSTTPLKKLQGASQFSSEFNDCKPFAADNPIWSLFTDPVAEAIVDLIKSPGTFHQSAHVAKGTVEACSHEEPWEPGDVAYVYYTRVMDVQSADEYAEILEHTGRKYPKDLPFVILQLQYLGFGSRGLSLLKEVMGALGYPDVGLEVNPSVEGTHPFARPLYSGTSIRSPKKREDEDMTTSENTSRIRNFSQLHKDIKWCIFVWTPLRQAIDHKLEWRTRKALGQVEAVLTDCIVPNFNKARGGWIHSIELHPTISAPLEIMLGMLPKPHALDPMPPALADDLTEMINLEKSLFELLRNSAEFGNLFGAPAMQHLKREFVEAIRCIKGATASMTLTKDLPQEAGRGLIDTSLDGQQVGRAVALYQAMMIAIYDLEGREERTYSILRQLDGSFIDFWHFFDLHKWWGLLILLIGIYFRRAMPYTIHSWSAVIGGIFSSNLLHTLPRDLGIESLQGPDAIAALTPDILNHPVIQQSYHVPHNRKFREKQGMADTVRIGTGKLDYANHLSKGDPGDLFYRQIFFVHDKRRHTLLNGLSIALNRLTEEHLATRVHPTTEEEKIRFFKEIREEFDRVAVESGVRNVLDKELRRQRICDQAQGALLGKSVEKVQKNGQGDDSGDDDENDVEAVRREKKRRRTGKKPSHPRHKGLLALGEPNSEERRQQLAGLQDDARVAILLGKSPEVLWFDKLTALSPEFVQVFHGFKENYSLQLALNAHGRTPEGIQGHKENGQRLAELNKAWALATRKEQTELLGGWIRAEQFEQLTMLIPKLGEDMTSHTFEKLQRAAKCTKEGCLQRVLGRGKNATHRCTEEAASAAIVKTSFDSYLPILYPHDLLTLSDIDADVRALAADHCHLAISPAIDWVFDKNGVLLLLATFPFPLHPDLFGSINGVVYWDDRKPKDAPENFLMAADVVLGNVCPGYGSLEVVAAGGGIVLDGADALYNKTQEKPWKQDFMNRVVDAVKRSGGGNWMGASAYDGEISKSSTGRNEST